jgi:curved DNA-binding protein CbpA
MINYYNILGVSKTASMNEIKEIFDILKTNKKINEKMIEAYDILSDYHRRRKYDEIIEKKSKLAQFNIPFFGNDYGDEYYISKSSSFYSNNPNIEVKEETKSQQIKKYKLSENTYLIYEKINNNGTVEKKYYLESNGNKEMIPENKINKLKEEYYKNTSTISLLKDKPIYKVL